MKKALIISSIFMFIAGGFVQAMNKQSNRQILQNGKDETTEIIYPSTEQKYLITNNGVDIFLIEQKIPDQTDGYLINKSIDIRTEEGEDFEIPVYTVSEDGEEVLNIELQYDYYEENYLDRIGNIYILSDKFKTAERIGLHSSIEEFIAVYPDFLIWYSYISDRYVIETKQLDSIQFILDGNDFTDEAGPTFDSDMTILKPSDFKKDSKIKGIRIWGY